MGNILVCFAFLLACLQPWLNPETFWPIGFLSLALPYLLVVLLLFFVVWLFVKWKWALLSAITMLAGIKQLPTLVAVKGNANSQALARLPPSDSVFRVFSWNVRSMKGLGSEDRASLLKNIDGIYDSVRRYQADVVCFQEFGRFERPNEGFDHMQRMKDLGYNHFILSNDYLRAAWRYTTGVAIFSKHPILASVRKPFTSNPESIIYADVLFRKDTIRVFTTHFQSYRFSHQEFTEIDNPDFQQKKQLARKSYHIFRKMQRAFRNRGNQADMIRPMLDTTRYPAILCCDLNDVPGSYAYWQMRGTNRSDAFLEKGLGIGRTFMALAPTLRIDYLFANPRIEVKAFATMANIHSDHRALIADLTLKK